MGGPGRAGSALPVLDKSSTRCTSHREAAFPKKRTSHIYGFTSKWLGPWGNTPCAPNYLRGGQGIESASLAPPTGANKMLRSH